MSVEEFLSHPEVVDILKQRLGDYLSAENDLCQLLSKAEGVAMVGHRVRMRGNGL